MFWGKILHATRNDNDEILQAPIEIKIPVWQLKVIVLGGSWHILTLWWGRSSARHLIGLEIFLISKIINIFSEVIFAAV